MIHIIHKIAKSRFCENPDFRLCLTPLKTAQMLKSDINRFILGQYRQREFEAISKSVKNEN